jgi:hypothetical protein
MVNHDGKVFVFEVFVQQVAQLSLGSNEMDPYGQSTAGEDRSPYLRLGSLVGTYGVKGYVDEHGARLLGFFLDVEHSSAFIHAALRAGAMGQLLLVTVRALGEARSRQEVVRAA